LVKYPGPANHPSLLSLSTEYTKPASPERPETRGQKPAHEGLKKVASIN